VKGFRQGLAKVRGVARRIARGPLFPSFIPHASHFCLYKRQFILHASLYCDPWRALNTAEAFWLTRYCTTYASRSSAADKRDVLGSAAVASPSAQRAASCEPRVPINIIATSTTAESSLILNLMQIAIVECLAGAPGSLSVDGNAINNLLSCIETIQGSSRFTLVYG
jgi:hypothetical protein